MEDLFLSKVQNIVVMNRLMHCYLNQGWIKKKKKNLNHNVTIHITVRNVIASRFTGMSSLVPL